MTASLRSSPLRLTCLVVTVISLSGCNALSRLSEVGEALKMSGIQNPTQTQDYKPITMPMPAPVLAHHNPNSLWRTGSRAFFKDLRANQIGDIVTVVIAVDDQADLENETARARAATEDAGLGALLGYQASLNRLLPQAVDPANLLNVNSNTSNNGNGSIARDEQITLRVAAVISQVLPNGNLVLHGRQEIRVNYEVREIQVTGVIRPQDITNENQIPHEQIAELRVSYGGRGQLSDLQQPRYGNQLIDIIFPF
ncbi:MAG: flagellar basal body L-ring protein FlgH [Proteobacteria bacterium]|nr:flagellar basal body L-ring protein FlgH [Pseudomonadota bacterium]